MVNCIAALPSWNFWKPSGYHGVAGMFGSKHLPSTSFMTPSAASEKAGLLKGAV